MTDSTTIVHKDWHDNNITQRLAGQQYYTTTDSTTILHNDW